MGNLDPRPQAGNRTSAPALTTRATAHAGTDPLSYHFQPPQSYRYLSQHMLLNLVNGHPASSSLLTVLQP
jgi:hypothetical protein